MDNPDEFIIDYATWNMDLPDIIPYSEVIKWADPGTNPVDYKMWVLSDKKI
jgi:hypothetical protein